MSDSVTNYNYVGDTKVSVSIKKKRSDRSPLMKYSKIDIINSLSRKLHVCPVNYAYSICYNFLFY